MSLRIWFESGHVTNDFAQGRLNITVRREDTASGQSLLDQIYFEVPPDFHTHNDLVATALMTLVGRAAPVVRFNFPISQRCAEMLAAYYSLDEVGPIDAALEPRRRGRFLGINFSGGLDSTALLVLLRASGVEIKVITSDYGEPFRRERIGYEQFHRDVTCATDLRDKGFGRRGRFNYAVPLLFANYLDLFGIAPGHPFQHEFPPSIESLDRGQQPLFRSREPAVTSGGLDEVHIIRGLTSLGCLAIVLTLAPDALERAFIAADAETGTKYVGKALLVHWLCAQRRIAVPDFLKSFDTGPAPPASGLANSGVSTLFMVKRLGVDVAARVAPGIQNRDLSFLEDLTVNFFEKYNTNFISLIPGDMRNQILATLHRCGIYPFDERDWRELGVVRDFINTQR